MKNENFQERIKEEKKSSIKMINEPFSSCAFAFFPVLEFRITPRGHKTNTRFTVITKSCVIIIWTISYSNLKYIKFLANKIMMKIKIMRKFSFFYEADLGWVTINFLLRWEPHTCVDCSHENLKHTKKKRGNKKIFPFHMRI